MPARRLSVLLSASALLLASLPGAAAQEQGRVDYTGRDGRDRWHIGTVQKETLTEVEVSTGKGRRTVATADVWRVKYGRGSDAYRRGLKALQAGDLENALAQLGLAAKDEQPAWVAAVALLRQAEASARRGSAGLSLAQGALDEFLTRWPNHRRLPEAHLLRARLAAAVGNQAAAGRATEAVIQLARDGKVSADWAVRARVERAEALLEAGDGPGAGEAFAEAQREADGAARALADRPHRKPVLSALRLRSQVGQGSSLLQQDDLPGARSYYQKLAREAGDDPELLAAAGNGLAECDFLGGGDGLKQAQVGFARMALRSAGYPEEHARALYYLGRCAEALGRRGEEPNWRSRMNRYFQDVQERYPDTRWARLARAAGS